MGTSSLQRSRERVESLDRNLTFSAHFTVLQTPDDGKPFGMTEVNGDDEGDWQ